MKSNIETAKKLADEKLRRKEHKELVDALSVSHEDVLKKVGDVLSGRDIKVYGKDKVEVTNFPKQEPFPDIPTFPPRLDVDVKNFPEQKEIKIPEFPNKIEIKKPKWYNKISLDPVLKKVTTLGLAIVKGFKENLDEHKKAENAFAVRLTTADGKAFYEAGGGGGGIGGNVGINPPENCGSGQKDVTTAGTAETLAVSTNCKSVTIKAKTGNSGSIYVGNSGVSSANGFILAAGDTVSLDIDNLTDIYLDTSSDGDGVSYIYVS